MSSENLVPLAPQQQVLLPAPAAVAVPVPPIPMPAPAPVECYCPHPISHPLQPPIRCVKCQRKYHPTCIPAMHQFGIFFGDDFFEYECMRCNGGVIVSESGPVDMKQEGAQEVDPRTVSYDPKTEVLRRYRLQWIDVVHIAMFHLTHTTQAKFFQYRRHVCEFINANWQKFFKKVKLDENTGWHSNVAGALSGHCPEKFISSKMAAEQSGAAKVSGQAGWWALSQPHRVPSSYETKKSGHKPTARVVGDHLEPLEMATASNKGASSEGAKQSKQAKSAEEPGKQAKGSDAKPAKEAKPKKEKKQPATKRKLAQTDVSERASSAEVDSVVAKSPAPEVPLTAITASTSEDVQQQPASKRRKTTTKKKKTAQSKPDRPSIQLFLDLVNPTDAPVRMSRHATHTAPQFHVSDDQMSVWNDKGYRMTKATHGMDTGTWYFECRVVKGPGTGNNDDTDAQNKSNLRIGWAQISADLQTPCGYDTFGYSYRAEPASLFHDALGRPFGPGYREGDVLGVMIHLPPQPSLTSEKGEPCDPLPAPWDRKHIYNTVTYYLPRPICHGSWIRYFLNGQEVGDAVAFENL